MILVQLAFDLDTSLVVHVLQREEFDALVDAVGHVDVGDDTNFASPFHIHLPILVPAQFELLRESERTREVVAHLLSELFALAQTPPVVLRIAASIPQPVLADEAHGRVSALSLSRVLREDRFSDRLLSVTHDLGEVTLLIGAHAHAP